LAQLQLATYQHLADLAADSLTNTDYDKFWKTVRKQNNAKATKLAHVIDGCCGDDAIAEGGGIIFKSCIIV